MKLYTNHLPNLKHVIQIGNPFVIRHKVKYNKRYDTIAVKVSLQSENEKSYNMIHCRIPQTRFRLKYEVSHTHSSNLLFTSVDM